MAEKLVNSVQQRARELRQNQTLAEQAMWQQLRAKRFSGFKFRRQEPIGRYIADFVCFSAKLIIELDGEQHLAQREHDENRDTWLATQGFRVLRFWNNEWLSQPEAVLDTIFSALYAPSPDPSPIKGEGRCSNVLPVAPIPLALLGEGLGERD